MTEQEFEKWTKSLLKRKCTKCGVEKDLSQFGKNRNGLRTDCKQCCTKRIKKWLINNPEKAHRYEQTRKHNHFLKAPPTKRNSCRIYIKKCELTGRIFVSKNKNKRFHPSISSSEIRALNLSKGRNILEFMECSICGAEYQGTNVSKTCSDLCEKERKRNLAMKANAKRKGSTHLEYISRDEIFIAFNWICACCGVDTPEELKGTNHDHAPTIDHIIPLSLGGSHTKENIQLLCRSCNTAKGNSIDSPKELIIVTSLNHQLNHQIYEKQREFNNC